MSNVKLTFLGFENNLFSCEELCSRDQYVFKFDNGFGASVIRAPGSMGFSKDLWELLTIRFYTDRGKETWDEFPIKGLTDNRPYGVIGFLSNKSVLKYLKRIKSLDPWIPRFFKSFSACLSRPASSCICTIDTQDDCDKVLDDIIECYHCKYFPRSGPLVGIRIPWYCNPDFFDETFKEAFIKCVNKGKPLFIYLNTECSFENLIALLDVVSSVSTMECFYYNGINYYIHPSFHAFIIVDKALETHFSDSVKLRFISLEDGGKDAI